MIDITKSENKFLNAFIVLFILGSCSLLIFVIVFACKGHVLLFGDLSFEKLSSFGDFVGGSIGTLFTISATVLIWLTYHSQKEELSKTNQTALLQTKNLEIQQFEGTYFLMAKELRSIPDSVSGDLPVLTDSVTGGEPFETDLSGEFHVSRENGRDFFIHAAEVLLVYISFYLDDSLTSNQKEEKIPLLYMEFYAKYLDELDHYFRYFYNILKFVDNSSIENKKLYTDLLQAQLSKYELSLIYYNGIGYFGKPKLYPLLEKYNFLENTNPSLIYKFETEPPLSFYPYTTFRFLTAEQKKTILDDAFLSNPDKVKQENKISYYTSKYNL